MCGVPIERADDYLQRLIALGHRVAVCEQLEDPAEAKKRGAKSVVRRDVVRLVTPGTMTEERLLEPGRPNLLLAVSASEGAPTASRSTASPSLDISTGDFVLAEAEEAALGAGIRASRTQRDRRARKPVRRPGIRAARQGSRHRRLRRSRAKAARARSGGSPSSTASRRSTASASSRAPKSPRPRWRSPMSSARRSTRRRISSPPQRRRARDDAGDRRGDARQSRTDAHACPASAPARCSRRSISPERRPARG